MDGQSIQPVKAMRTEEIALAGMVKRIDAELVTTTIFDPASLADAKALLA